MLTRDPSARITAAEAFAHTWVQFHHPPTFDHDLSQQLLTNLKGFKVDRGEDQ